MSYTAPALLFAAILLFLMFEKIQLPVFFNNIIKILSPAAFGVYLIHDNRKIREFYIYGVSTPFSGYEPLDAITSVLLIVIKIYCICLFIDFLRYHVFRLLKLKELLSKLEIYLLGNLWNQQP